MDLFDEGAWRKGWRTAGLRRRIRIRKAVGRGMALPDREDAFLAVGLVREGKSRWWLNWLVAALFVAVVLLVRDIGSGWPNLAILIAFQTYAIVWAPIPSGSFKVREALQRNEAVLEGFNAGPLNNASFEEIAAWRSSSPNPLRAR